MIVMHTTTVPIVWTSDNYIVRHIYFDQIIIGTLNWSTLPSTGIDSSKVTSAAADIGTVGDERAEDNDGGEDKGVLELIGRLVDDDERRPNQYEVPRPGTVATTMFVEGSVKNEDELTGGAIEDDEMRANAYDVPRSANAYDVPRPANAYDVPRPTTGATYYNI